MSHIIFYAGEIAQFSIIHIIVNNVDRLQQSCCNGHKN